MRFVGGGILCRRALAASRYYRHSSTVAILHNLIPKTALPSRELQPIDLEAEYDKTLERIVRDNKETLQSHFRVERSEDHTDEVQVLLKTAAKELNWNYQEVKNRRSDVERRKCPVRLYNNFLKWLYFDYGMEYEDMNFRKLHHAYNQLPYPPPKYIQPKHLEDLLSLMMGPIRTTHEGLLVPSVQNSWRMYLEIMNDLVKSGMPVSIWEHNTAMNFVLNHSIHEEEDDDVDAVTNGKWALAQQGYIELKKSMGNRIRDVSTLNLLLSVAINTHGNAAGVIESIAQEFKLQKLKANRFTVVNYIIYQGKQGNIEEVEKLFQDMYESGYVIDVSLVALIIKNMFRSREFETAEKMIQLLLSSNAYSKSKSGGPDTRIKKLQLIDYLLDIVSKDSARLRYSIPIVPDYSMMFTIFRCYSVYLGDLQKSMSIFQAMLDRNWTTRHVFYKFYQAFRKHYKGGWQLNHLNYITEILVSLEKDEHYTKSMARLALSAYRSVETHQGGTGKIVEDIYIQVMKNKKLPINVLVHRLLSELSKSNF